MKNKTITYLMIVSLVMVSILPGTISFAEGGLLPSLSETVGIAMPSLGEALQRYPDSETENEDGSVTEIYTNVSETDFNTFSVYLEQQKAELADYKAEKGVFTAEIRAKGASFSLQYDSKSGEARVIYPSGTFDEWVRNAKTHFDAAQKLFAEGKKDEASAEIFAIPQFMKYGPVKEDENLAAAVIAAREAEYAPYKRAGNVVTFGTYPQTEEGTDQTPVEWIVLDYDETNHKTLLISKYGLDEYAYNGRYTDITWEQCDLRAWLNDGFLNEAFSEKERSAIMVTNVDNSSNQGYIEWNVDGGNNTQDQIFLLSYAEANRYLDVTRDDSNSKKSRVALTDYAARRALTSDNDQTADGKPAGWWWLRSPGGEQHYAACVNSDGSLSFDDVSFYRCCVRPALWLNLDADIF